MKKIGSIILTLTIIVATLLAGCGGDATSSKIPESDSSPSEIDETASNVNSANSNVNSSDFDVDVDITEKMYVAYINEIYVNAEDYIGQTIRIQGMHQAYTDENTGQTYYYVYRTGPGCCGNDGAMCGFEFTWDGSMPDNNDWIEVVGSLSSYEEDGWTYLTLDAKSVTVMEERGAETVYQ